MAQMIIKGHTVKKWSMPEEEKLAGSVIYCSRCETPIYHIWDIDGRWYGSDCAARVLGLPIKRLPKIAAELESIQQNENWFAEERARKAAIESTLTFSSKEYNPKTIWLQASHYKLLELLTERPLWSTPDSSWDFMDLYHVGMVERAEYENTWIFRITDGGRAHLAAFQQQTE